MATPTLSPAERLAALERAIRRRSDASDASIISGTDDEDDVETARRKSTAGRLVWGEGGEGTWMPYGTEEEAGTILPGSGRRIGGVKKVEKDDTEADGEEYKENSGVDEVEGADENTDMIPASEADSMHHPEISGAPIHRVGSDLPLSPSPPLVESTSNITSEASLSSAIPLPRSDTRAVSWADANKDRIIVGEIPAFAMRPLHEPTEGLTSLSSSSSSLSGFTGDIASDARRVHSALQAMEAVDRFLLGLDRPSMGLDSQTTDAVSTEEAETAASPASGPVLRPTSASVRLSDSAYLQSHRTQSTPITHDEPLKPYNRVQSAPASRSRGTSLWRGSRTSISASGSRPSWSASADFRRPSVQFSLSSFPHTDSDPAEVRRDASAQALRNSRTSITEPKPRTRERSSMSARMEDLEVAKARSIAEAITRAAAQWDPSQRQSNSSLYSSTRPSRPASALTLEKRAASAASCAAAATGGRRSRPASGRIGTSVQNLDTKPSEPHQTGFRLPKTPKELWSLVRETYCPRIFDALSARVPQPIPYTLTLRHGFQFKYSLRHRQALIWVCPHLKVPIHHADGKLESEMDGEEESQSPKDNVDDSEFDLRALPGQSKYHSYTFAAVDRTGTISLWDVARNTDTNRPRGVVKLMTEITEFVFIKKFAVYAACSQDKNIKFFNSRFEMTNLHHTMEPILFIRYNSLNHGLVTAGSHSICVWTMEATKHRNIIRVVPTVKHTFHTHLPRDEWISNLYLDEKNLRIYAVVDTKILVFHQTHGTHIDTLRNISTRHVSALIHHDFYQYTLIACTDGSIQVRNMNNAIVHEFTGHTKPVTSLALYPQGPMIISCAMDYTVRVYSLKTFKEIYCLHLRERPLSLTVIDDDQLLIRTRETIDVWSLNHINSGFSSLNSHVKTLLRVKSPGIQPRILVRTEDGIVRLLSPVNGKAITTALPLLETDYLHDLAYCSKIDRMFFMLENGEIWVMATNFNPCVVVDIWKLGEAVREDCSHIAIFDGRFSPADEVPPGYDSVKGYAFLLGATRNGQVLVYGRRGGVRDRYQLHNAEITQMLCDQKQQLLFTCGADETIKITKVSPTSPEILHPILSIRTHFIPRVISVLGSTICAAAEEGSLWMYEFSVEKREWRMHPTHNRSDDHTDNVTAICPIPKLDLFVSASKDGTLRVWDTGNTLVRELQFQESIDSLSIANAHGDILFGIQNRVDIIKYQSYLPPGYVQTVQKMEHKEYVPEQPVPFDDARIEWKNLLCRGQRKLVLNTQDPWSLFHDINLVGPEKPFEGPEPPHSKGERDMYKDLLERLDLIALQRRQIVEMAKQRLEAEQAEGVREDEILHQEFLRYMRNKPFWGLSRGGSMGELRPTSPTEGPGRLLDIPVPISREAGVGGMVGGEVIEAGGAVVMVGKGEVSEAITLPSPLSNEDTPPPLPSKKSSKKRFQKRLIFAPDGQLPNSLLHKEVLDWKSTHSTFSLPAAVIPRAGKPKTSTPQSTDDTKKKRSEEYKKRLKEMLDALPREEEVTGGPEGGEEVVVEEAEEEEVEEAERAARLRLPPQRMRFGTLEPRVKEMVEVKLPIVVEKLLAYDWVPVDQLFYPPQDPTNPPPPTSRKLKIDADSHTLLPLVLDIFRTTTSSQTRMEIVEYINWMYEEHGIKDATGIVKAFCRVLGTAEADGEQDVPMRCALIESLARYGPNHVDVVPSLLMQLASRHETVRNRAIQFLKALGVHTPDNPFLVHAVEEILSEVVATTKVTPQPAHPGPTTAWDTTSVTQSQAQQETSRPLSATYQDPRIPLTNFIRKNLKKYLLRSTSNKEVAQKLKKLNIHGVEDRTLEERGDDERPGSSKSRPGTAGSRTHSRPDSGGMGSRPGSGKGARPGSGANARPGSGLGARPGSGVNARPGSGVTARPGSGVDARSETVMKPGLGRETSGVSIGAGKQPDTEKAAEVRQSIPGRGKKRVAFGTPLSSAGAFKSPSAQADKGLLQQDGRRISIEIPTAPDAGILKHDGMRHSVDIPELEWMEMVTYRPSVPLGEGDMGSNEETPFYQAFEIDRPPSSRNPVTILQNPCGQDFINALNFYILSRERAAAKAEQERLEKLRQESEAAARMAAEADKKQKFMEYMAKKERERLERLEARKKRLDEARRREEAKARLPALVQGKLSAMRTQGIGLTHKSECHPSRETLDYEYRKFPPIADGHTHGPHHTGISMHIQKYNRSMPMERVEIVPFDPFLQRETTPLKRNSPRTFSAARPPTSIPLGSTLVPSQLVPQWQEFNIENSEAVIERELRDFFPDGDLKYIRAGLKSAEAASGGMVHDGGADTKFRTQRKYFIPALSMALETVAAGQTYGLAD
ncbi:uncharacterized protein SPPG_07330 [Spizellomyces punctatus DAOM BR117]|uniref:Uncharacterized protein n=1 Tax=Spizellomyces punctatus (strain DAOM BR117) TaxID=645134 RepID=A0A0L0H8Y7_SPIPD|nr:uncharacterized protein SPPG_07330 [Spizellomyces punctatus DAOM BR117]KNC97404.1 hypothetical protein SPPG_07330 [Spizellomyces punctatus DAOM BR117]|eukprot:XP_016605444.1 hypothetical protein SPPG_07330 [Spizellomyces punctatus DAOM BR117]